MANTLITPSVIASAALPTLYNTALLLPLVNRDYDSEFNGKQGDTITVRTPASFTVNEYSRSTGIVLQNATEGSFTVVLDTLPDVSFAVTSEEMTLKIDRFEERLLNPAMEAHAQWVDGKIAEKLVDAAESSGGGGTVTGTGSTAGDQHKAFRKARRVLGRNKLPFTERYAVLSPEAVETVTGDNLVLQANTAGSTEALREGSVGRLSGFNTYESQAFGLGLQDGAGSDAGQADGVAFHRSAVAAVTRTLDAPMGLAPSQYSVKEYKGLGLRVVYAYDNDKKQDAVSIDALFGVTTIRKTAAVQLDFGLGS
jgi:hypothetical protein